ncbi:MAG: hypothetical protein ACI4DN_08740 [Lachnospiraceae bacterium]
MRRFSKQVLVMLCMTILLGMGVVQKANAAAGDSVTILKMVTAEVTTEAKLEPDDAAGALTTFNAGSDILVVEEIDEEWYSIVYKGEIGYVRRADTVDKVIDVEAIDEELAAEEYQGRLMMEEVEKKNAESKQSKIWGVIIVLLVLAIFGVGIYSHLVSKKNGNKEEK